MTARIVPNDTSKAHEKFDADGNVKRHDGSTVVCHVIPDSPVHRAAAEIRAMVQDSEVAHDFGLLPVASFHMTVLEGLKDRHLPREEQRWPEWLSNTVDFPDAVYHMTSRLRSANIAPPEAIRMRIKGLYPFEQSVTIGVEPWDDHVTRELERFRQEVGSVLEIDVPTLDEYAFHISIGYRLNSSNGEAESSAYLARMRDTANVLLDGIDTVDLDRPAFNIFSDMLAFPPLLYFGTDYGASEVTGTFGKGYSSKNML